MPPRHVASVAALVLLALTGGCFASPKLDEDPSDGGSSGIGLDGSDSAPYVPTTSAAATDSRGESSSDGSGSTSVVGSDTTEGSGSADDGASESTGGDPWNEDDVPAGFPGIEPFGDDVRELDLVGSWTMPWDPTGVADIELAIADDGSFVWHERAADCSEVGIASGTMWVAGSQLVMHFASWDKRAPWDSEGEIAVTIDPPYRMRLGYSPMGGYLGISAPAELTAVADWSGRGYLRLDAGSGGGGNWGAEAELWAVPPGESGPLLIARDRFDAHLGSGDAQLVHGRTWWWPQQLARPDDAAAGPWSDDTPGNVAGAATVLGVMHAYDAVGLLSFAADRSFKLGITSDCG
jgi:hypothetical protein